MTNKQTSILTGISLGVFTLAIMFYSHVDKQIMAQNRLQAQRLDEFQEWSEGICKNGYSVAEFLENGEYKAKCN